MSQVQALRQHPTSQTCRHLPASLANRKSAVVDPYPVLGTSAMTVDILVRRHCEIRKHGQLRHVCCGITRSVIILVYAD